MKFKIYQDKHTDVDELETITSFLRWQKQEQYVIWSSFSALEYSKGKSHVHIRAFDSNNKSLGGFNTFNELFHWFDEKGLIRAQPVYIGKSDRIKFHRSLTNTL